MTASDVAKAVGVSRSTVSRAFTPNAYVKPGVRDEILRISKSLGYEPNRLAQALISRQSPVVGIVIHGLSNPFHAEIYAALTQELQRTGFTPLTAQLSQDKDIGAALATFRQYQVSRVILTSFAVTDDIIETCLASGLEVLLLNRTDEAARCSAVSADLAQGGGLAARHLIQQGRRRIAILDGLAGSWTATVRAEGYLRELAQHDMAPLRRLPGTYVYQSGLDAAALLFDGGTVPDAVLCANDLSAFGLMDGLRQAGLRIPDDVAVVGYDDVPMAAWQAYDLTTIRLPIRQMVSRLCDLLTDRPSDDLPALEATFFSCRLIERSSA
ncbi:MAG: LacI family DNA-binding transcriptional regulator [Pseudomonadota bacterium]